MEESKIFPVEAIIALVFQQTAEQAPSGYCRSHFYSWRKPNGQATEQISLPLLCLRRCRCYAGLSCRHASCCLTVDLVSTSANSRACLLPMVRPSCHHQAARFELPPPFCFSWKPTCCRSSLAISHRSIFASHRSNFASHRSSLQPTGS